MGEKLPLSQKIGANKKLFKINKFFELNLLTPYQNYSGYDPDSNTK